MQIGIFKTADEVADVAIKELIDVLSVADVKTVGVATGSTPLALSRSGNVLSDGFQGVRA